MHENIPILNEIVPNQAVSKDGSSSYSMIQAIVDNTQEYWYLPLIHSETIHNAMKNSNGGSILPFLKDSFQTLG